MSILSVNTKSLYILSILCLVNKYYLVVSNMNSELYRSVFGKNFPNNNRANGLNGNNMRNRNISDELSFSQLNVDNLDAINGNKNNGPGNGQNDNGQNGQTIRPGNGQNGNGQDGNGKNDILPEPINGRNGNDRPNGNNDKPVTLPEPLPDNGELNDLAEKLRELLCNRNGQTNRPGNGQNNNGQNGQTNRPENGQNGQDDNGNNRPGNGQNGNSNNGNNIFNGLSNVLQYIINLLAGQLPTSMVYLNESIENFEFTGVPKSFRKTARVGTDDVIKIDVGDGVERIVFDAVLHFTTENNLGIPVTMDPYIVYLLKYGDEKRAYIRNLSMDVPVGIHNNTLSMTDGFEVPDLGLDKTLEIHLINMDFIKDNTLITAVGNAYAQLDLPEILPEPR